MADRDPFEALARVADEPERPDAGFAERLLQHLLDELGPSIPDLGPHDGDVEPVAAVEIRREAPMRTSRWRWAAGAAAAVVLAVIVIAIATRRDNDTMIVDHPTPTVDDGEESTTPTPAASRFDGPSWCARTITVLADVDDDGNFLLEAEQAWVDEAPPGMVEAARAYDELIRTAPVIRAADPDFDTKLESARSEIDAYVDENC